MAPTPQGVDGYYDPTQRRVVISPGLTGPEMASTLAHELVHAEVGDRNAGTWWSRTNSDAVEDCADEVAARALIMLHDLADSLLSRDSAQQVADDLRVDVEMVQVRLDTLTAAERRYVDRRTASSPPLRRLA